LDNLTLATFLNAELGFLGVVVYTLIHTPFFCGDRSNAGTLFLYFGLILGFFINWLIVGII